MFYLWGMESKKACSKCGLFKEIAEFRQRTDKRRTPYLVYLNNICRQCEREYTSSWYNQSKQDVNWVKENGKRINEYQIKSGYNKRRWQVNKNDVNWIKRLKEWRNDNIDSVKKNQSKRGLKYHIKNRDCISDAYCINHIINQFEGITTDFILNHPELIEIKRTQILIHREINN